MLKKNTVCFYINFFFIGQLTIYGNRSFVVMSGFFLEYPEFLPQFLWFLSYFLVSWFVSVQISVTSISWLADLYTSHFPALTLLHFLLSCCLKFPFTGLGISSSNACQLVVLSPTPAQTPQNWSEKYWSYNNEWKD